MRYVLLTALAGAVLWAGCKKPQGPQTTDPNASVRPAGQLKALEPPEADAPPPRPTEPMPLVMDEPIVPPTPAGAAETAKLDLAAGTEPAGRAIAAEPERVYLVQKGDTLWRIAAKLYGNGQRYRDIAAANPGIEPTRLRVGQKLLIPRP
jgi:5'-nucleotidase